MKVMKSSRMLPVSSYGAIEDFVQLCMLVATNIYSICKNYYHNIIMHMVAIKVQ